MNGWRSMQQGRHVPPLRKLSCRKWLGSITFYTYKGWWTTVIVHPIKILGGGYVATLVCSNLPTTHIPSLIIVFWSWIHSVQLKSGARSFQKYIHVQLSINISISCVSWGKLVVYKSHSRFSASYLKECWNAGEISQFRLLWFATGVVIFFQCSSLK